jgi:hypothetical protein
MMDIDTGVLCAQQMLTHERSEDILPMLQGYVARCAELQQRLPTRVASDRGLRDAALINDTTAFPDAHINVDNWHFQQRFLKTLNKKSTAYKACHDAFSMAVYKQMTLPNGASGKTHAEPDAILRDVHAILEKFAERGEQGAAVTKATFEWWKDQKDGIEQRMLSNPIGGPEVAVETVSSSRQESYHSVLNRKTRMVSTSAGHMHAILMQLMHRWNTSRRRKYQLEPDWGTFDLQLVIDAFQAATFVLSDEGATRLFSGCPIPRRLAGEEFFGLIHTNTTLEQQTSAADQLLPVSEELMQRILANLSADFSQMRQAIEAALPTIDERSQSVVISASSLNSSSVTTAVTALESTSTSRVTSSQWLVQHTNIPVMAFRLNAIEKVLLRTALRTDKQLIGLCNDNLWELAASRWNAIINNLSANSHLPSEMRGARPMTEDTMKTEVKLARKDSARDAELQHIHLLATHPHPVYKEVSSRKTRFTESEDALLLELAKKYPAKKKGEIRWKDVSSAWRARWTAGQEVGETNIYPRTRAGLKNRHRYITQEGKEVRPTSPPASSAESSHSDGKSDDEEDGSEEEKQMVASSPDISAIEAPHSTEASSSACARRGKRKYKSMSAEAQLEFRRLYTDGRMRSS